MLAVRVHAPAPGVAVLGRIPVARGDAAREAAVLLERDHGGAVLAGHVRSAVRRSVVDDEHVGLGKLLVQLVENGGEVVLLVPGGDEDERVGHGERVRRRSTTLGNRVTETFTTRPELRGTFGMVASTHWIASAAGMAALERGGNAFDAAVTAGFVLQVVEPHMNGPGGEVPILLYSAERDEVLVVCGQGVAPEAATISRIRDLGLELVPGTGLLPACVPGAFDAWLLLLRDFGTLALADVLEPAIGYAETGYPVVPGIRSTIASMERMFREEWPGSAELYLPVPAAGSLFRNRSLAATWRRVLDEAGEGSREAVIDAARDAFYRGFVAEAIASFAAETEVMDSSGRRHRGLLTGDDLAGWQASVEAPVELDYAGWRVSKTAPWGQGPVFLQQLALLSRFDLGSLGRESADFVHVVVECAKLAFADREAWYGDPAFSEVPLDDLLSAGYAEERARLVGDEASGELRPGSPGGRSPRLPRIPIAAEAAPGIGEPTRRGDTCHVDVVDRWGNVVSATPSGGWLDGSPVIPEPRFLSRHARPDVLAGGGPAEFARAAQAAADDALADAGPARRRDARVRHARRRPAGRVVARLLPHARALRRRPAGGDRRADVPHRALSVVVLSAAALGRGCSSSRAGSVRTSPPSSAGGGISSSRRAHGRSAGSAPPETDGTVLRAAANPRGMQGYAVGR